MDDGSDALGTDNGPDKECNASGGDKVGLDGKEMPDLLDGKPNSRERSCPEEEEGDECDCIGARTWNAVGNATIASVLRMLECLLHFIQNTYITPIIPDTADHEVNAGASYPCLHAVPDTSHCSSVEHRP